jgi:hypothetical protein
MSFWDSFWPGLWSNGIATLVGVAVGVPVALSIDRRLRSARRRREQADRDGRLRRLTDALRETIQSNADGLAELERLVVDGKVSLTVDFYAAMWDAVRADAVDLVDDPRLHILLANYFEDLGEVSRLQQQLIEVSYGLGSSMTNAPELRATLLEIVKSEIRAIMDQSDALLADDLFAASTDAG